VRDRIVFPVQLDRLKVLRDRGAILAGLGRHEEALALYRAGLALADSAGSPYRLSPEVVTLRLSLGLSHRALGEVEAARGAFERVLRDYPNAPEAGVAREGLADLYLVTEGVPPAEAQGWALATAMDPTSMAAFAIYDRLCAEQRRLGMLDRVVALYEAQRDLAPRSASIRVKLGVAYAAAGRIDDAARVYEEAISLVENPSDLFRQLAVIYGRAGRRAEAEAAAAKAEGR
jgi:tetratricopeptide (TPR) repeat protein